MIEIDWDYLQRITRRKVLLNTHRGLCIGWDELTRLAIRELYEEVMINQLPKRFPHMFSIRQSEFPNRVIGCQYSVKVADLGEDYMPATLAENVEEDFDFMCPDANGEYRLRAYRLLVIRCLRSLVFIH